MTRNSLLGPQVRRRRSRNVGEGRYGAWSEMIRADLCSGRISMEEAMARQQQIAGGIGRRRVANPRSRAQKEAEGLRFLSEIAQDIDQPVAKAWLKPAMASHLKRRVKASKKDAQRIVDKWFALQQEKAGIAAREYRRPSIGRKSWDASTGSWRAFNNPGSSTSPARRAYYKWNQVFGDELERLRPDLVGKIDWGETLYMQRKGEDPVQAAHAYAKHAKPKLHWMRNRGRNPFGYLAQGRTRPHAIRMTGQAIYKTRREAIAAARRAQEEMLRRGEDVVADAYVYHERKGRRRRQTKLRPMSRNPFYRYRTRVPGPGHSWKYGSMHAMDIQEADNRLYREYRDKAHVDIIGIKEQLDGQVRPIKRKVHRVSTRIWKPRQTARNGGRSGQRVYFRDRFGKTQSGRIVMRSSYPGSWVLNLGGRHGTPAVVRESDFISRPRKGSNPRRRRRSASRRTPRRRRSPVRRKRSQARHRRSPVRLKRDSRGRFVKRGRRAPRRRAANKRRR